MTRRGRFPGEARFPWGRDNCYIRPPRLLKSTFLKAKRTSLTGQYSEMMRTYNGQRYPSRGPCGICGISPNFDEGIADHPKLGDCSYSVTVKGVEEIGEPYHGGLSRSTIRIADVVTGQALPRCNRVIGGPQIPMCGVQEGSACGRRGWRVWSGDLWPIPVFLEGSDPARGVLGDARSFIIDS